MRPTILILALLLGGCGADDEPRDWSPVVLPSGATCATCYFDLGSGRLDACNFGEVVDGSCRVDSWSGSWSCQDPCSAPISGFEPGCGAWLCDRCPGNLPEPACVR